MVLDIQLTTDEAEDAKTRREFVLPNEPGLAIMGKEPFLGAVRRNSGLPVLRDELSNRMESGAL